MTIDEKDLNSFEAMFKKVLGGFSKQTQAPDDDDDDDRYDDNKGKVPVSRLRKSSRARKKAEARVTELEGQLTDLGKAAETSIAKMQKTHAKLLTDTVAAEVTKVQGNFERKDLLKGAGFNDAAGQTAALNAYNSIPEAGRPELEAQLKAWQEKPAEAPRTLGAYLTPADGKGGDIPNTAAGTKGADGKVDTSKMTDEECDAALLAL